MSNSNGSVFRDSLQRGGGAARASMEVHCRALVFCLLAEHRTSGVPAWMTPWWPGLRLSTAKESECDGCSGIAYVLLR